MIWRGFFTESYWFVHPRGIWGHIKFFAQYPFAWFKYISFNRKMSLRAKA